MMIRKFKMSFKLVWHIVSECSGWFGVVLCGFWAIAMPTVEPLHSFQFRSCSKVFAIWVLTPCCGDKKV